MWKAHVRCAEEVVLKCGVCVCVRDLCHLFDEVLFKKLWVRVSDVIWCFTWHVTSQDLQKGRTIKRNSHHLPQLKRWGVESLVSWIKRPRVEYEKTHGHAEKCANISPNVSLVSNSFPETISLYLKRKWPPPKGSCLQPSIFIELTLSFREEYVIKVHVLECNNLEEFGLASPALPNKNFRTHFKKKKATPVQIWPNYNSSPTTRGFPFQKAAIWWSPKKLTRQISSKPCLTCAFGMVFCLTSTFWTALKSHFWRLQLILADGTPTKNFPKNKKVVQTGSHFLWISDPWFKKNSSNNNHIPQESDPVYGGMIPNLFL